MKRYRVLTLDFDTRANILKIDIRSDWSPEIQTRWRTIQAGIKEALLAEFGARESEQKLSDSSTPVRHRSPLWPFTTDSFDRPGLHSLPAPIILRSRPLARLPSESSITSS